MLAPTACLCVVNGRTSWRYIDDIPKENLVSIKHLVPTRYFRDHPGYYMVLRYDCENNEYYGEHVKYIRSYRSFKITLDRISNWYNPETYGHAKHHLIVKYTDRTFTTMTDILIDDPIVAVMSARLNGDLKTQYEISILLT